MDFDSRYVVRRESGIGRVLKILLTLAGILAALYGVYKFLDSKFGKKDDGASKLAGKEKEPDENSLEADAGDVLNAEENAADDE